MDFILLCITVLVIVSDSAFSCFGAVPQYSAPNPYLGPEIYGNVTTNIIANYGDSVQFECYAAGNPIISWYRDNDIQEFLLPNGKTEYEGNVLKFPSVTHKFAGIYVCNATDNNGYSSYKFYSLLLRSAPLITQTHQTNGLGYSIKLQCIGVSHPRSAFKWYKNGELLAIEDRDEVDYWNSDLLAGSVVGSINISKQNNDFEGTYKCEIENELGKDEKIFEIRGKGNQHKLNFKRFRTMYDFIYKIKPLRNN